MKSPHLSMPTPNPSSAAARTWQHPLARPVAALALLLAVAALFVPGFLHLEIKDGHATGRLLRPVVAGPEKARLIREHAKERGHDLNECFAYSDSYSDVPMLSVVGHPACVNPDTKLRQLAHAYSWPIVQLS